MTMGPLTHNKDVIRECLNRARSCSLKSRRKNRRQYFTELSMGMSSDYEIAVREGADILRIGSAFSQADFRTLYFFTIGHVALVMLFFSIFSANYILNIDNL